MADNWASPFFAFQVIAHKDGVLTAGLGTVRFWAGKDLYVCQFVNLSHIPCMDIVMKIVDMFQGAPKITFS